MGDVINLRTVRKRATRKRDDALASEKRAVHGRNKVEWQREAKLRDKAEQQLDQHRIETGDDR